jgi:hypothetical protein
MSLADGNDYPLAARYEGAPVGDATFVAASFFASLLVLALTSYMTKAPLKTTSLAAAVILALLNAGLSFHIHGFLVRIIQSALGAIGTAAMASWLSLRDTAGRVAAAVIAAPAARPKGAAGADESAEVQAHFFAAWSGWPQIMAFYEVVCLGQRWEIARNRMVAAQSAYNHLKANHDVLHPTDDNYTSSAAMLMTSMAQVNREAVVLSHQEDRYKTVKQVYKNACRSDVFEPNTHSSFFAKINDAGQQRFNQAVNAKYGDLTLATIKDFVRRIKDGEVEESDQPAAKPAAAAIGDEEEALALPSAGGGAASAAKPKKQRAGSVAPQ